MLGGTDPHKHIFHRQSWHYLNVPVMCSINCNKTFAMTFARHREIPWLLRGFNVAKGSWNDFEVWMLDRVSGIIMSFERYQMCRDNCEVWTLLRGQGIMRFESCTQVPELLWGLSVTLYTGPDVIRRFERYTKVLGLSWSWSLSRATGILMGFKHYNTQVRGISWGFNVTQKSRIIIRFGRYSDVPGFRTFHKGSGIVMRFGHHTESQLLLWGLDDIQKLSLNVTHKFIDHCVLT